MMFGRLDLLNICSSQVQGCVPTDPAAQETEAGGLFELKEFESIVHYEHT